jgi:serine/threonine protein kinase
MQSPSGEAVAVKRMPTKWVRRGAAEFDKEYPRAAERPWNDFGIVRELNTRRFPYVCDLLGIFRDDVNTFVITSLASEGDGFAWCQKAPRPGMQREDIIKPLVVQIFDSVRWIHALGIAHRDLSLENVLITKDETGQLQIKLIDFGNASLQRRCSGVYGKKSYQAPEVHVEHGYDAFLIDAFSTGVVVFAMAMKEYPWYSTKTDGCQMFMYARRQGFIKLLEKRKVSSPGAGQGERMIDVLSPELKLVMGGLLKFEPQDRAPLSDLGAAHTVPSVWETAWVKGCQSWTPLPAQGKKMRVRTSL